MSSCQVPFFGVSARDPSSFQVITRHSTFYVDIESDAFSVLGLEYGGL
jgi:hypothetical protein